MYHTLKMILLFFAVSLVASLGAWWELSQNQL